MDQSPQSPDAYDPTKIEPVTKFVALNPIDIIQDFETVKTESDYGKKIQLLADGIEGFNILNENILWETEVSVINEANSIRTLPHVCRKEQELISTIQPAAWSKNIAGGMYDPITDQICQNCVGHWGGRASSLKQHLCQSIATPCFIAYHIIALISVCIGLIIAHSSPLVLANPGHQKYALTVIICVALGYDLLSIICVLLYESYFPDDPDPFEATKIQKSVENTMKSNLDLFVNTMTSKTIEEFDAKHEMTPAELCSVFFVNRFYKPAVDSLKNTLISRGKFHKDKAQNFTWNEYEDLLAVFRFARELSDSDITKTTDTTDPDPPRQIEDAVKKNMRESIVSAIWKAPDEVALQLLRLVSCSLLPPETRRELIRQNHSALTMTHIVGGAMVYDILNDLRRTPRGVDKVREAWVDAARSVGSASEELMSYRSHASRVYESA